MMRIEASLSRGYKEAGERITFRVWDRQLSKDRDDLVRSYPGCY